MTAQSSPSLLLLPGFDGTGELFAPLRTALAPDHSVTVARYEKEESFDDYLATIEGLLPDRDAVLIAESFSGPLALTMMARHPERIRCAVLCATFAVGPFRSLARAAARFPAVFFEPSPQQRLVLRLFCLNGASEMLDPAVTTLRSVKAATLRQRLRVLADFDVRSLLPQVRAPILYLRAKDDRIVSARLSTALVGSLPSVVEQEVDGPHLLLQTRPQRCAELIVDFLACLSQRPER